MKTDDLWSLASLRELFYSANIPLPLVFHLEISVNRTQIVEYWCNQPLGKYCNEWWPNPLRYL